MNRDSSEPAPEAPSKSQRKREARALFDLGRSLVGLDSTTLQRLPLEARLREAVDQARGIRAHVAHKRQLQYIARLLRSIDAEPIHAAIEALRSEARRQAATHHRIEAWRDRLLAEGDAALPELLAVCGHGEAQTLRQLVRNARREAELDKPPTAARKLFRLLRDIQAQQPLPPAGPDSA
jgi:ribosome-associated protein